MSLARLRKRSTKPAEAERDEEGIAYAPYQTFWELPGIVSLFAFRPETAKPMRALAEVLLRGPGTLTSGERELIATYVSSRNDCYFLPDQSWRSGRVSLWQQRTTDCGREAELRGNIDEFFCQSIHGAVAAYNLGGNERLVVDVKQNYEGASVSARNSRRCLPLPVRCSNPASR